MQDALDLIKQEIEVTLHRRHELSTRDLKGNMKHSMGKSPCSFHQPNEQVAKRRRPLFVTKDQPSAVLTISLAMPFWDRNGEKLGDVASSFVHCHWNIKKVWLDKSMYYRERLSSLKSLFLLHSEFVWAKWTQMTRRNQQGLFFQVRQTCRIFHIITILLFLSWIIPWGPYSCPAPVRPEAKTKLSGLGGYTAFSCLLSCAINACGCSYSKNSKSQYLCPVSVR